MRKIETVVVPQWPGNRDVGKRFVITEMSAAQAEKWALRMFIALKGSKARIPDHVAGLGMVGVMLIGMNTFLQADVEFGAIEPLLDEMMVCVKMIRDPKAIDPMTGGAVATEIVSDDDIEEVQTRAWLRAEVLRVHTNFSIPEAFSALMSSISSTTLADSSTT